jgi:hypothetical protein
MTYPSSIFNSFDRGLESYFLSEASMILEGSGITESFWGMEFNVSILKVPKSAQFTRCIA